MKRLFLYFFTTISILSSGCGENLIFDQQQTLPNGIWSYRDSINFDFSIADTSKIYNLYVSVEHQEDYPYQNIYVMTHTKFPTGERPAQRINIDLATNSGQWLGEKSGKSFTHRVDLQQNAYFNRVGNYTLTLHQFMRQDSLPIRSVRFAIEDAKLSREKVTIKQGERPKNEKQEKYLIR
jgi:gliding motility-associated lipoprotein GldH